MNVNSESEVTQLYLTLSDPADCNLPGSSFHGIYQAGVLKWGAIAFSALLKHIASSASSNCLVLMNETSLRKSLRLKSNVTLLVKSREWTSTM